MRLDSETVGDHPYSIRRNRKASESAVPPRLWRELKPQSPGAFAQLPPHNLHGRKFRNLKRKHWPLPP